MPPPHSGYKKELLGGTHDTAHDRPVQRYGDKTDRGHAATHGTAELGDYGRGGDPTVAEFESMAAKRMSKEVALSGAMGNQIAILTHTGRAGEVLGEATSHVFRSELGVSP